MKRFNFLQPIDKNTVADLRGDLSILEIPNGNSFHTKRLYYISNVPSDSIRGAHAHKTLNQIFIALNGSFTLNVTDGKSEDSVCLDAESSGYFLPSGLWRELRDFTEDAICLVLASEHFDESDYLRDYNKFLAWKNQNES